MIDWLESIDRSIVLTVNSWNSPFLDEVCWVFSARITWVPLYLLLIYLSWKHFGTKKTLLFVGIVVATIGLADVTSVYFFKENFQRYRPSHHALLTDKLHFYLTGKDKLGNNEYYKGGMYGFVSSHATNFFALTILIGLSLRQRFPKLIWVLLGISVLICFSRLYLGAHYLSDLIGGAIWGSLLSYLSYRFIVKPYLLTPKE